MHAFEELPLAEKHRTPVGVATATLAVVMADGGRLQLRDAEPEETAALGVEAAARTAAVASPTEPLPQAAAPVAPPAGPGTEASAATAEAGGVAAAVTGAPKPARPRGGKHWREDRVALLLTMESTAATADPCPQIPELFVVHRAVEAQRLRHPERGVSRRAQSV